MGMKFSIRPGALGDCGGCLKPLKADDNHKVFSKFDEPLPAVPEFGIEECTGVWVFMHRRCAEKRGLL
jgi:hypothetical protein